MGRQLAKEVLNNPLFGSMVGVVGTSVFEGSADAGVMVGCEVLAGAGPYGIIIAAVILYICLAWKYPDMVLPSTFAIITMTMFPMFPPILVHYVIQTILKENPSITDQDLLSQAA